MTKDEMIVEFRKGKKYCWFLGNLSPHPDFDILLEMERDGLIQRVETKTDLIETEQNYVIFKWVFM